MHSWVILANYLAYYKMLLFSEILKINKYLRVIYIAETEAKREWKIKKEEIDFPFEIMFDKAIDDVPKLSLLRKTWSRLNALNPDLLIIDGYSDASCWAGFVWARKNSKKIVLWSSSNFDDRKRDFVRELIKGYFVKGCHAYNVYGSKSREYVIKLGAEKDKVFIIGNSTDNNYFYNETRKWRADAVSLRNRYGIPEKNFIYIGRFSREKNIFYLLEAYRRLQKDVSHDWGLILVGSGPQEEEIRGFIDEYGLKNVFLTGFKQKEEIPKFLAVSRAIVLPSISEPWGLVINEAMAAGLPVLVSAKCGCYPDLVREGINGFSFDPSDKDQLSRLMEDVVEGKVDLEKMGNASLEIIKDYTPAKAARLVMKTVKLVLNGDH